MTLSKRAHDIVAQITRLWPDVGFSDAELETIDQVWTRLNQTRLEATIRVERARSGKAPNLGRIAIEAGLDDLAVAGQDRQQSAGEMLRIRRAREEAEHSRCVESLRPIIDQLSGAQASAIDSLAFRAIVQANRSGPRVMSPSFAEQKREQWVRQLTNIAAGEEISAPMMEVLYLLEDAARAERRGGLYV